MVAKTKTILITGAAGFIGYHLCKKLLQNDYYVVGIDNINDYYSVELKYSRLGLLGIDSEKAKKFHIKVTSSTYEKKMTFIRMDLEDKNRLSNLFSDYNFDIVCNLAAQAGVRYSLKKPEKYIKSNLVGFYNILECCKDSKVNRLVYASSSSVYGNNPNVPFKEIENVDKPISLYAATKKSNELMAYAYSHLYSIETIGLRFFTVYGPWGRPDMALFLFTEAMINNQPINVFNNGNLYRDFTYIDDLTDSLCKVLFVNSKNKNNYKIYNLGNNSPVKLLDFIDSLEKEIGIKSNMKMLPMQPGDVEKTWADTSEFIKDYGPAKTTKIKYGVKKFIDWYKSNIK